MFIFGAIFIIGKYSFEAKTDLPKDDTPNLKKINWDKRSPISAQKCEEFERRLRAVMISGNDRVRPVSGLSKAAMVFEIPVTQGGINRFMAVYGCKQPTEIGSIRSARNDFIPLAKSLDAIYAHWGGSHLALRRLGQNILDNVNALVDPYNAFFRKPGYESPDNGFTTSERLLRAARKSGYRMKNEFEGYAHVHPSNLASTSIKKKTRTLYLGYPGKYEVTWHYQSGENNFIRYRNGQVEVDKLTGNPIEAVNIVVIRADSKHRKGQYIDVALEQEGKALFYRGGREFEGKWNKAADPESSKLEFFQAGKEFRFFPGPIWIEVIGPKKEVRWK